MPTPELMLNRIETCLRRDFPVKDVAAIIEGREPGGVAIMIYVVPEGTYNCDNIRQHVRAMLRDDTNVTVIFASALPHDEHGLLDRKALIDSARQRDDGLSLPSAIRSSNSTADSILSDPTNDHDRTPVNAAKTSADPRQAGLPAIAIGRELPSDALRADTLATSLRRAARDPEAGITFVSTNGARFRSYNDVWTTALSIASALRAFGVTPRSKVLIALRSDNDFVDAFWGVLVAGCVPCPVALRPRGDPAQEKVQLYMSAERADARVMIVPEDVARVCDDHGPIVALLDDLRLSPAIDAPISSDPDDLALLLATSGSTGPPKFVSHTHRTIFARSRAAAGHIGIDATDVSLNWLPLDHVGALVKCHIHDIVVGCRQVQVERDFILRNPLRWINLMSEYQITNTWAPNFAFALVNAALRWQTGTPNWNLSTVRIIINTGERIMAAHARDFLVYLHPYGLASHVMRPTWGMSETCASVTISGDFANHDDNDDDHVSVGEPIPGVSLRVVSPAGTVLREGEEGQLEVTGDCVTPGYFRDDVANAASFTDDGWFRTGDRALIRDRQLTITGRDKEVIIVNGMNLAPHEIEKHVCRAEGVDSQAVAAVAFRDRGDATDRVAVFVALMPGADPRSVTKAIRARVHDTLGIRVDRVIVKHPGDFPRTSIGKVQRSRLAAEIKRGGQQ